MSLTTVHSNTLFDAIKKQKYIKCITPSLQLKHGPYKTQLWVLAFKQAENPEIAGPCGLCGKFLRPNHTTGDSQPYTYPQLLYLFQQPAPLLAPDLALVYHNDNIN